MSMELEHSKLSNKLELKTLILFILNKFGEAVTEEQLDFVAEDYVSDRFAYIVAKSELVASGLLSTDMDMRSLTVKGTYTLKQVESTLPPATRRRAAEDAERLIAHLHRERYISTSHEPAEGGMRVSMLLESGEGTLLDLKLLMPTESLAEAAEQSFRANAEKIYSELAEKLIDNSK